MKLQNFFIDRNPNPKIEVSDGSLYFGLAGYDLWIMPQDGNSYKVLKLGDKFSVNPSEVESYEFYPGQPTTLANIARFVHDYTEPDTWETL